MSTDRAHTRFLVGLIDTTETFAIFWWTRYNFQERSAAFCDYSAKEIFFSFKPSVQQILTLVSPDGHSCRGRSVQWGRRAERQKGRGYPRGSLAEDRGIVSPAAWCPPFPSHSCALTSLLGVTEHRRGASAAMRSTNESFLTRCPSCVTSPNG